MLEIEERERKKQIGVMPPKKRLKQTKEKSAKANEARGSGSQVEGSWLDDKTRGKRVVFGSESLLSLHKPRWKDIEKC